MTIVLGTCMFSQTINGMKLYNILIFLTFSSVEGVDCIENTPGLMNT